MSCRSPANVSGGHAYSAHAGLREKESLPLSWKSFTPACANRDGICAGSSPSDNAAIALLRVQLNLSFRQRSGRNLLPTQHL